MKNSSILNRNILKAFEFLLRAGVISVDYIKNWADNIIEKENVCESEVIEISTSSSKNEAITLLNYLSKDCNLKLVSRAILGITYNFYAEQNLSLEQLTKLTSTIYNDGNLENFEKKRIFGFDDAYFLAIRNVYGDLNIIEKEISKTLTIYKDFTLENYNIWHIVNENLESENALNLP